MIDIPNWVVQVAAVWFLYDKINLFSKRFEGWVKRRGYEKARQENEKDYYAGYEDVRSVPPDQFPTFEEWRKEREREETERKQAEKEQRDLDLLKTFNQKKWEQIMAEKSAKERQEYQAHRAYLESIRPPDVSKIEWLQQHGIHWDPPVGWVADSGDIAPNPVVQGNTPAGVTETVKEAGESQEGLEYRRL
jgi:hypothetical protein